MAPAETQSEHHGGGFGGGKSRVWSPPAAAGYEQQVKKSRHWGSRRLRQLLYGLPQETEQGEVERGTRRAPAQEGDVTMDWNQISRRT